MVGVDTVLIAAILALDIVGLTLDFKSYKLYENYFKERTKWYQSRGNNSNKKAAVVLPAAPDASK